MSSHRRRYSRRELLGNVQVDSGGAQASLSDGAFRAERVPLRPGARLPIFEPDI